MFMHQGAVCAAWTVVLIKIDLAVMLAMQPQRNQRLSSSAVPTAASATIALELQSAVAPTVALTVGLTVRVHQQL